MPHPMNAHLPLHRLIDRIERNNSTLSSPFIVAIDGRSGCGKSTLADLTAAGLNTHRQQRATVISADQFYKGGSSTTWDNRTAAENAATAIDWQQQRRVLESLKATGQADWQAFNWHSNAWNTDTPSFISTHLDGSPVILLEGVYSTRLELADLLDLCVLLRVPDNTRQARLLEREGQDYNHAWHRRWTAAEDYYFATLNTDTHMILPPDGSTDSWHGNRKTLRQ